MSPTDDGQLATTPLIGEVQAAASSAALRRDHLPLCGSDGGLVRGEL